MSRLLTTVSILFFSLTQKLCLGVVNKDVQRTLDATSSILKLYAEIKVANANKEYDFIFPTYQAKNIALISVKAKGKLLEILAPVNKQNTTVYSVRVGDASPTLKLEVIFTSLLEPYPAEIKQSDHQLVRFTDSHYFLSPYRTESQKTTVKLASSGIESFTKMAPHSVRSSTITFGPYKEVEAYAFSPATMHFVNNKPFAKFSTMTREVEVSHWGNVAVEEVYELKHAGAKLLGGFSRFDYQMKRERQSPSFRTLDAELPLSAHNIYYRDQIGNISTSDLFVEDGKLQMIIETRFPMFGGWQTQFYLGYSLPTEDTLFIDSESGRYKLKVDFFTIFKDVWVEDMEIKVVLPEGCTDITVDAPYPMEQSRTTRFTYLDSAFTGGRTVINLRAKNLVKEHSEGITVSYRFQQSRMIIEPLMLVTSFLTFFVVCILLARIDTIGPAKTKETK